MCIDSVLVFCYLAYAIIKLFFCKQKTTLGSDPNVAVLVLLCAVCIQHRLDLFHQRIIILLVVDSAKHRFSHNISISID